MAKRSTRGKPVWSLILIGIAVFLVTALGSYYLITYLRNRTKPETPGSARVTLVNETYRSKVTVFLPARGKDKIYLAPQTRTATGKDGILDLAIKTLLLEGSRDGDKERVIPAGVKLLQPVKVEDDTAIIDFSQELLDNFNGGSEMEALTLNSIAQTAVHADKRVRKIRILVGGKPVDSLGGHFDLSVPISPDQFLLQPD